MRQIYAIFFKEFNGFFSGLQGYFTISIYLTFVGGMVFYLNDVFSQSLVDFRMFFFWASVGLLVLVPALTMRTLAEENNKGSIEVLMTLPVADEILIIGKYLSVVSFIIISVMLTFFYPLSLGFYSDLDWGAVLGGYLGLILQGSAFAAIGIAVSCSSSNQMLSFLLTFLICSFPFVVGFTLKQVSGNILPFVQYLSFEYHFNYLARGVLDSRGVIYYCSVIAVFLHIALMQFELRRLRS
ncbi:MAG: gliding motility-associated ABC transporter permease subunit GldF [Proteobacteria bacterium]|nr:gliding motility-associated ABC transporter permease subunit GldF [Pseudomonadota bacterium]